MFRRPRNCRATSELLSTTAARRGRGVRARNAGVPPPDNARCGYVAIATGARGHAVCEKQTDSPFRVDSEPVQSRFRVDSESRFRVGSESIPNRFRVDSEPVQSRFRTGSESIQSRFRVGSERLIGSAPPRNGVSARHTYRVNDRRFDGSICAIDVRIASTRRWCR